MHERILMIESGGTPRESLEMVLAAEGCSLVRVRDGREALDALASSPVDVVFCDLEVPGLDGFELIPQLIRRAGSVPVIAIAGEGVEEPGAVAMRRGAGAVLVEPLEASEIRFVLRQTRSLEGLRRENQLLQREIGRAIGDRPVVAASPPMIEVLEQVERTASTKTPALLVGEDGTGKETLARAIHDQSSRRAGPFVAVECAVSDADELRAALLGRGRTRGGDLPPCGLILAADGGTLYLDQVCALPTPLQSIFVELLQDEAIQLEGAAKSQAADVRILAGAHALPGVEDSQPDLQGDLLGRLGEDHLAVPALRDRREDIPLLLDHFLACYRRTLGKPIRSFADDALGRLSTYRWPGNLRELQNVVERAVILADSDRITLRELPETVVSSEYSDGDSRTEDYSLRRARRTAEAHIIARALRATDGNRTHAAKLLAISHRALLYKIKEYGIRD